MNESRSPSLGQTPRYLRSVDSAVVHDTWSLSERCNTDDIPGADRRHPEEEEVARKANAGEWRRCEHCGSASDTFVMVRFHKQDGSAFSLAERAQLAKSLDGIAKRQGLRAFGAD